MTSSVGTAGLEGARLIRPPGIDNPPRVDGARLIRPPSDTALVRPARPAEAPLSAAALTALRPDEEVVQGGEVKRLLGERLGNWLDGFAKKSGEAWKRLTETKVAKQVTEYIKSYHPYISLALGPVLGAGIGFINPEWGQWVLAHSGHIRMAAVAAMPLFSSMEAVTGRETKMGRLARAARFVAWDVSLAAMTAPFGVGVGIEGREMMTEALKHFPAPTPAEATTSPVEPSPTATQHPTEAASPTATAVPPTEASPATATPDIQPTWEVGHPPTNDQLDWAQNHHNVTESGGFLRYNLDSDTQPEVYVHQASGHTWWQTPEGKWAVDSIPNDGVLKPDAVYSSPPVPEPTGSGHAPHRALIMMPEAARSPNLEPPLPDYKDINGDGRWDLFKMPDGTWRFDADGSSYTLDSNNLPVVDSTKMSAEQQVNITGLVDNGGVWDWTDAHVTTLDGTYEWKFDGTSWVQSDLLSPVERGVHDVNPDVTISAGQGKWHAGENYLKGTLSNPATAADSGLVGNLSEGTGANTIAVDAVKDVLESHHVPTTVDDSGNYHVNIDPSYNQEIGARIQVTVDKINAWFTPGMDATKKNEILAEMSSRGLIPVKNLTVEGLEALGKLASALQKGS